MQRRVFFLDAVTQESRSLMTVVHAEGDEYSFVQQRGVWTQSVVASHAAPASEVSSALPPASEAASEGTDGAAADLVAHVRESVVGDRSAFRGPHGFRRIVYLDYTASGRALSFLEDYIRDEVMPLYGNTHTMATETGHQTTLFREEARELVRRAVNATDDKDVVVFCGSGATGAIAKLVHILGLRSRAAHPTAAVHRCSFPGCGRSFADAGDLKLHQQTHRDGHFESGKTSAPGGESSTSVGPAGVGVGAGTGAGAGAGTNAGTGPSGTPSAVVFVGPYAHHSNILPWSESGAHVVPIPEARGGGVDMDALQAALDQYSDPSIFKVGAFTLASNVTGCVCDDDAVTRLLHAKGALAVWDCAASAPHVPINMNPMDTETMARRPDGTSALAKDAVFFSPHKFCGGPCTPGVLVVKRSLMTNAVPSTPGGGTVFFVHKDGTPRYLQNEAEREEGGTPNIVGAVRAGLVMHLQRSVGYDRIMELENSMADEARRRWSAHPNIVIASGATVQRIAIVSFVVRHRDRLLHWSLVTQILNDLFGIQSRGGCLCAGPYSQELLGMTGQEALDLETCLLHRDEMLRPGFSRVSFPYHMPRHEFEYAVKAVLWVATNGHKLLQQYVPLADTGEWKHQSFGGRPRPRRWLHSVSFSSGRMNYPPSASITQTQAGPATAAELDEYLKAADDIADATSLTRNDKAVLFAHGRTSTTAVGLLSAEGEKLRWFAVAADEHSASRDERAPPPAWLRRIQGMPPPGGEHGAGAPAGAGAGADVDGGAAVSSGDASAADAPGMVKDDEEEEDDDPLGAVGGDLFDEDDTDNAATARRRVIVTPPHNIVRASGKAIREFNMIKDGDSVMVGLSGGKDSLSLLHVLLDYQRRSPVSFTLRACTVDPQSPGFDPSPLKGYMSSLGVPYTIESDDIIGRAALIMQGTSICAFCSRMRRGMLYTACRREGCNVLALGQHLDDLAESMLISTFFNGKLRTMKPHYVNDAGDMRIIRPLSYVRERWLREFATVGGLPIIEDNCPACFSAPQERYRMKTLLSSQEHVYPRLFASLQKAMLPLMLAGRGTEIAGGRADGALMVKDDDQDVKGIGFREAGAAAGAGAGPGAGLSAGLDVGAEGVSTFPLIIDDDDDEDDIGPTGDPEFPTCPLPAS